MNPPLRSLEECLAAMNVKRYHTWPITGDQTVGNHTARVMMIIDFLTDGRPSVSLLRAALYHDAAEFALGDLPSPIKWKYPELSKLVQRIEHDFDEHNGILVELSSEEMLLLKTADILELMAFAKDQERLGNQNATRIYRNGLNYVYTLYGGDDKNFPKRVSEFLSQLTEWSSGV